MDCKGSVCDGRAKVADRQVYLFGIEQAVRVGEAVFAPDLTAVVPAVESLHGK